MNRIRQLQIASALRAEKAGAGGPRTMLQGFCAAEEAAAAHLAKLTPDERRLLLATLSGMLKRERRRCRARAAQYDAGRHIGLYIAVKHLTANNKPGA